MPLQGLTRRRNSQRRRTSHRRRTNNTKNQCDKTYIVQTLLKMLRTVKLHHWKTKSYSQHKATDELYERMNEKMDRFAEVYMGKDGKRIGAWNKDMELMFGSAFSDGAFEKNVHAFREFLINLDRCLDPKQDSDLLSIRDDLLGDVNQFLYLYTLR